MAAFQPVKSPEPLVASITKLGQGETGELLVSVNASRRAFLELRYTVPGIDGAPGPWTTFPLFHAKRVPVNGLTPGTIYAFQVRALRMQGSTDWGESVSRMCV